MKTILCVLLIVGGVCSRNEEYGSDTLSDTSYGRNQRQQQSGIYGDRNENESELGGRTQRPSTGTGRPSSSSGFFTDSENSNSNNNNRRPAGSVGGSRGNERPSSTSDRDRDRERPGQQQSGFFINYENETPGESYGSSDNTKKPNRQTFSQGNEYNQRPNQQNSGSYGNEHTNRPNQQSSWSNNEYNQRPNQQSTGSSNNQRPNQQSSWSNNEYNQRPNQQSSGSSNNQRPNQQNSWSNNEYNQRPNQQSSGSHNNQRPNQQNSWSNNEYNQRPNQQSSGSQNNQRPSGSQFSQNRPNQQSGSQNNKRPNQQSSGSYNENSNSSPQSQTTSNDTDKAKEKELCYDIFGCFSVLEPWTSKLRPVPGPLPPQNNSASMYFYSRPNTDQRYLVNIYPEFSMGEAKFNPRRPTAIIIHGFIQDGNELWMDEMKNAYLKKVDANVMIVDWGKGSRRLSYLQAAGNTRLIGTMVAHLIKRLIYEQGAKAENFHLIGHSLGAQIASYVGKEVPNLGRITALDPAQPGFEGFDKRVRLDKSDAKFVDVVHTNAKPFIPTLGLGMMKPYGHVDFYMNGGFDQPLCVSPPKNGIKEIKSILDLANLPVDWFSQTFFCDHARAHAYFTEAINNTDCIFWGHKATTKNVAQGIANTLTQGLLSQYVALSTTCSRDDCVPMGLTTVDSSVRGSVVVTTNGKFPYCRSEPGIPAEKPSRDSNNNNNNNKRS